jgi:hypothetical protein
MALNAMVWFDTMRERNDQWQLAAPGRTRLLEHPFKQPHKQISEDVQLFFAHLNSEGSYGHLQMFSFQPSTFARWGLIALSATALSRAGRRSLQLCNQLPQVRSVLHQYTGVSA